MKSIIVIAGVAWLSSVGMVAGQFLTVTTISGSETVTGYDDGSAAEALWYDPTAAATAPDGTVWIVSADTQVLRRIAPGGSLVTLAGDLYNQGVADGLALTLGSIIHKA